MDTVAARLEYVTERIGRAARLAGRDPAAVQLVVVTKTHPVELVAQVIAAGARHIGENYAEEGFEKQQTLGSQAACVQWHMIGHVQSRKASLVAAHYDYLHSLDTPKLAARLERAAAEAGRILPVLLECNLSGEASKSGFAAWEQARWKDLLPEIEPIVRSPHLQVRGLMTMPPFTEDPEQARPYFRLLRLLRDYLAQHFSQSNWSELSMGMSADFEVAIQEGATWVRVGTAITGPRPSV